jgi:hypothetical protein
VVLRVDESEDNKVMKNIGKYALYSSLFLTLGGGEAGSAHAPVRPPFFLAKNIRGQQEAVLIARIRLMGSFPLKTPITGFETGKYYRSFAFTPHVSFEKTGRIIQVTEAIVRRNEQKSGLLFE